MGVLNYLQHGYNMLTDSRRRDAPGNAYPFYGMGATSRPDRTPYRRILDRTTVTAVYSRISIDCAALSIQHVKTDDTGRYDSTIKDTLNECLTLSANKDQTGRAFIQDVVYSLCEEGCIAVVPFRMDVNPADGAFKIEEMRVARITQWFPDNVTVEIYNEDTGNRDSLTVPKAITAIIENPLYPVMNATNSTAQRLMRKIELLDQLDDKLGSNRLDLIIQLPYLARSPQKRAQAQARLKDVEFQLTNSKYGIAYIDNTEQVTQLNRSIENTLPEQIEALRNQFYNQLGMTQAVFEGTADDATMLNYYSRTTEPILSAIADEFKRKFLSKTARTQGHSVMFFRDPFKLVPAQQIAEIADKMTRNEILSPNEIRAIIGYKPSGDPKSDELRNRNLNQDAQSAAEGDVPTAPK